EARALEGSEYLLGDVVADDRHEPTPVLAQKPGTPGVGAERAHHRPRRPPQDLAQLQRRAGVLAHDEQRLRVTQSLLRLLVPARVTDGHRRRGRQRFTQGLLFGSEHVTLPVEDREDSDELALEEERES